MAQTLWWKRSYHQTKNLIANFWVKLFPKLTIIGVTGSYGKTNTSLAIQTVLSQKFQTLMTDLNKDTVYNLPITLLKLRPKHQQLILELGVDHQGEMTSYLKLVKPSIGVLTGISPVHSDPGLLGSLEGIKEEKGKLLESLPKDGFAVLNYDDLIVRKMASKTKAKKIWYSNQSQKVDYWAKNIKVGFDVTRFTLCCHDLNHDNKKREIKLKSGLIGRHFVNAALVAAIIGKIQGLSWRQINKGLADLRPLRGRVSIEKGPKGSILINDSLRANPASTIAGLQVLSDLPTGGKRIAVLGEMGELGKYALSSHQEVGKKVADLKIDTLISIGPLQKYTVLSAQKLGMNKEKIYWVEGVHGAAQILNRILKKGDLFYLKGSLLRHLERVLLILDGKKVGCKVVSCHYYNQCSVCPYLEKGFPE